MGKININDLDYYDSDDYVPRQKLKKGKKPSIYNNTDKVEDDEPSEEAS